MKVFLRKFLLSAVFAAILTGFSTCYAAGGKMPVLMYHDLTNDPAKTNSMKITGRRIRLDMELLKEFGYTPLLPADLTDVRGNLLAAAGTVVTAGVISRAMAHGKLFALTLLCCGNGYGR